MAAKLKKGDKVVVLAGKDKGKEGEITAVMPTKGKAIVDGVNIAIRHQRQTQPVAAFNLEQVMRLLCHAAQVQHRLDAQIGIG